MAGADPAYMPEEVSSAIDFVSNEDRRYFEAHPTAKYYDRSPHPLEFWPGRTDTKNMLVRVFQITPGYRIRCPYPEGGRPNKRKLKKIKEVKRAFKKGKLSLPPRDERLFDIHFVQMVF